VVLKGLVDLESKCRQRLIVTAAAQRQLDRAGRVAKLPATDLKNIQVFVASAKGHLQCSVKLSQRRLFSDQDSASDLRRHAA
jgi:hypothetical protein